MRSGRRSGQDDTTCTWSRSTGLVSLSLRFAHIFLIHSSYYPLFPPAAGAQLDLNMLDHLRMPVVPDVLLLPSELRFFAKAVDHSVCINPGRLAKKQAGGTFAKLSILPLVVAAEVDPASMVPHNVSDRASVEIVRI